MPLPHALRTPEPGAAAFRAEQVFYFADRALVALPDHALWWPERRALLAADLHLEKASWYAATGQFLPPYDSRATVARLAALADAVDAAAIFLLGDSFHDPAGVHRLCDAARAGLERIAARRRLVWVAGNHDGLAGGAVAGECVDEVECDGIVLRHHSDPADPRPEISGHFHPKARVVVRGRAVVRRCFVTGPNRLILPAFGALAGGLWAEDPAIRSVIGAPAAATIATQRRLIHIPFRERPAPTVANLS